MILATEVGHLIHEDDPLQFIKNMRGFVSHFGVEEEAKDCLKEAPKFDENTHILGRWE